LGARYIEPPRRPDSPATLRLGDRGL